jgi:hypothetical protein
VPNRLIHPAPRLLDLPWDLGRGRGPNHLWVRPFHRFIFAQRPASRVRRGEHESPRSSFLPGITGIRLERLQLPRISEFLGVSIYVYYDDHPPPHFQAIYSGQEAVILIDTLRVYRGDLPPRVLGLVLEWAFRHRPELGDVWRQAERLETVPRIPPLE